MLPDHKIIRFFIPRAGLDNNMWQFRPLKRANPPLRNLIPPGIPIMVPRGARAPAAGAGVPGGIIARNNFQNFNSPSFTRSRPFWRYAPPSHPRILLPQYTQRFRIPPRTVRFYPILRPTRKTLYPFPHQRVIHSLNDTFRHKGPSKPEVPLVSPQRNQYTEVPHFSIPKPFIPRDVRPSPPPGGLGLPVHNSSSPLDGSNTKNPTNGPGQEPTHKPVICSIKVVVTPSDQLPSSSSSPRRIFTVPDVIPEHRRVVPSRLDILKSGLTDSGLSEVVIDTILKVHRSTTLNQYQSIWAVNF